MPLSAGSASSSRNCSKLRTPEAKSRSPSKQLRASDSPGDQGGPHTTTSLARPAMQKQVSLNRPRDRIIGSLQRTIDTSDLYS